MHRFFVFALVMALLMFGCSQRPKRRHPQPDDPAKAQVERVLLGMIAAHIEGDERYLAYVSDEWLRLDGPGGSEKADKKKMKILLDSFLDRTKREAVSVKAGINLEKLSTASYYDLGDEAFRAARRFRDCRRNMEEGDILAVAYNKTDPDDGSAVPKRLIAIFSRKDGGWVLKAAGVETKPDEY